MNKKRLLYNEQGQGLTEYLIILILVSLVAVGAATTLGSTVNQKIEKANKRIKTKVNFGEK